jgi:hypothetical protein
MHELLRAVFTLGSASRQLRRRRSSVQFSPVSQQDASDRLARTFPAVSAARSESRNVTSDRSGSAKTLVGASQINSLSGFIGLH